MVKRRDAEAQRKGGGRRGFDRMRSSFADVEA
jgi:hypothetical protein